ncbi:hypothetical protein BBJ28_00014362 [Nothophytophthora sp. Chile5]|nr:hypothetical protein BBJ28_00014362 [Nothophytophthora sp. Chile5]
MAPAPLAVVTFLFREKPEVAALTHVICAISSFLDSSVEIPLAHACTLGSLALLDRIWDSSEPALPSVVDRHGWTLCKFLRADRHYYRAQFAKALTKAVRLGSLDVVRWLFAHFSGCVASVDVVEEAASAGHLHILQFLWANGRHVQAGRGQDEIRHEGQEPHNGNIVSWGGGDMAAAAKRGHGDIVRWLYEHTGDVDRDLSRIMRYTVRKCDLPLVQWLLATVYRDVPELPPPTFNDATRCGHLFLLPWLFEQGYVGDVGDAFRNASMSGYFEIVKWLVEHGILDNVQEGVQGASACGYFPTVVWLLERNLGRDASRSMYLAAINGHLEVAQYVHAKGIDDYGENTMYKAAERGHLGVVKWLYAEFASHPDIDLFPVSRPNADGYPQYPTAMDAAASNGHLEVLQFLHDVGASLETSPERRKRKRAKERGRPKLDKRGPTCTRAAMTNAVAEGHLEVAQWLHSNRYEGCSPSAINTAARNGHLEMVKWMHEHTMVSCTTSAIDGAAANGHLEVVQWLHKNRTEGCTTIAMDRAASKGHLDVIQWLHANRREGCTSFAMDSAARSGHLQVVQWLHTHRSEGCTDNAMDGAAYNGHLAIVQWLHTHRTEGCTIDAMHFAAVHGYFEVLLFLHSQRTEGCSRYATVDAAGRGHTEIVAWLRQYYSAS